MVSSMWDRCAVASLGTSRQTEGTKKDRIYVSIARVVCMDIGKQELVHE